MRYLLVPLSPKWDYPGSIWMYKDYSGCIWTYEDHPRCFVECALQPSRYDNMRKAMIADADPKHANGRFGARGRAVAPISVLEPPPFESLDQTFSLLLFLKMPNCTRHRRGNHNRDPPLTHRRDLASHPLESDPKSTS